MRGDRRRHTSQVPHHLGLLCALLAIGAAGPGCSFLLPREQTSVASPWGSYDEARHAFEQIQLGQTRTADLAELGFDPYRNQNVRVIDFMGVYRTFVDHRAMGLELQHPGVVRCIEERERCHGLEVEPWREQGKEHGNFLLNYLGFREQSTVERWVFQAMLVVVDETVVYKLYAGSPLDLKKRDKIRPLGPLQEIDVKVKLKLPFP